ncbi:MAG: hypothetical protein VB093_19370 [Propionicimonas sp.]|nr:hypothetical protein [Propionicimonas sp.]
MGRRADRRRDQDSTEADSLLPEFFAPETTPGPTAGPPAPEPSAEAPAGEAGTSRVSGWGRVFRGNRALWVTVIVAVACLIAGIGMGRFVLSPADAAANAAAPDPGYITVPVEYGELSNDVTLRGQVGYADSTEVKLTASELADAAVITGHVPEVGDELDAGSIALEIAGRPVFVLPGQLPSYRTLRMGASGPDVTQLRKALRALGIDVSKSGKFDKELAEGLRTLYSDAGYTPAVDATAKAGVTTARQAVRDAEKALASARTALKNAGVTKSTRQTLNNAVIQAQNAVKVAKAKLAEAKKAGALDSELLELKGQVKAAEGQVKVAKAARTEGLKVDTSSYKAAVTSAEQQLADAKKQLTTAQNAARPYLPAAEVLYLTQLPRRVDVVNVQRGSLIDGPVMSVSGATIELTGSAADADAKLLEIGGEASFELPDGTPHRAVIAKIETDPAGGRATITFTPDPLTTEQAQQLQGSNVRVQIPVGATEGKVLSVPFAALTAGPGGESRVEVVVGDPRDKEHATTTLVVVKTGLAADGYVEVTPVEGTLNEGDLVVVGT